MYLQTGTQPAPVAPFINTLEEDALERSCLPVNRLAIYRGVMYSLPCNILSSSCDFFHEKSKSLKDFLSWYSDVLTSGDAASSGK